MEHTNFYSIFKNEGVKFGRKHAKKDFSFFLQMFVLVGIANAIPMVINRIQHRPYDANNFGDIISLILSLLFGFGMVKIYLHFVHAKKVDLKDLINHDWARFLRWALAKIITGGLIFLGFILLIIPGIYMASRLYLAEFFVVDQKMTAIEAISASWEVTKGHVWQIIGIWFLSVGIILLGALALGVGLLWAVPTVKLAQAMLYKKLTSHDHHLE